MDNFEGRGPAAVGSLPGGQRTPTLRLTREQIDAYLRNLEASGYLPETLQNYRRSLNRLYRFLNGDGCVHMGTLAAWQEYLLAVGCSARTVNVYMAAVNGLMAFLGYRELQAGRLPEKKKDQPELTRGEYLRLLSAAKRLGKERAYLLVKVFGTTGILIGELENLTVEAARTGWIPLPSGGLRISKGLRGELRRFARREGIQSGPVFLAKDGTPQNRRVVTGIIQTLCRDAQVPEEKATPRCLRKLCRTTQEDIKENLSRLAERTYDRLLEKEHQAAGWER